MKPRVYDGLVHPPSNCVASGTGQSTVEEGREASGNGCENMTGGQPRAWAEGFKAGSSELFNDPHNPYRKENA